MSTSDLRAAAASASTVPVKAVHTWSLFRTLGRRCVPGSMPSGNIPEGGGVESGGLPLLELPAALASHGFASAQLCHFYLESLEDAYLARVRQAFQDAGVEIEALLVDDGDLTAPDADAQIAWIDQYVAAAGTLGARRVRVVAGMQPPSEESIAASASGLLQLAERHPDTRIVTENFQALLPDAASVLQLLHLTGDRVGFLVDLGNWKGAGKYAELSQVAGLAETCQAKASTDEAGSIDTDDYRRCLMVLREAGYAGPLALVHDGPDDDEWGKLDEAYALVEQVYGDEGA